MLLQSLSIFRRHSEGLAGQFQAEKRMLSPLDAVVLVQFLEGPLLPLSATIGFEEGEVPLERDLQTTSFTSLNSPNPFLPAGQLTPQFHSERWTCHAAVDGKVAQF